MKYGCGTVLGTVGRRALILSFVLALVRAPASATQSGGDSLRIVSVDTSGYPAVALRVIPPRGAVAVAKQGLPAEAFRLWENGAPRPLEVTRLPLGHIEVVLMLDTSSSMAGGPLQAAQNAAVRFVLRLPEGARVGVIGFGDEPLQSFPLSDDARSTVAGIRSLQPRGRTALSPAVSTALGQLRAASAARRAVVMVSDGGGAVPASSVDAAAAASRSGVAFYVIRVPTSETDVAGISTLASAVGAQLMAVSEVGELVHLLDEAGDELINQYRVSFVSQGRPPTNVRVAFDHRGVKTEVTQLINLPSSAPESSASPRDERAVNPPVRAPAPGSPPPRAWPGMWAVVVGAGAACVAVVASSLRTVVRGPGGRSALAVIAVGVLMACIIGTVVGLLTPLVAPVIRSFLGL